MHIVAYSVYALRGKETASYLLLCLPQACHHARHISRIAKLMTIVMLPVYTVYHLSEQEALMLLHQGCLV